MKILVVDDHPLVQQALTHLLPHLGRAVQVIGTGDPGEAYAALAAHPDCRLLLLDLALPGTRGLELLAALRRDFPRLPIAVISATHDRGTVDAALRAGARGFIAKTASPIVLIDAVQRLLEGRPCPRPEISRIPAPPDPVMGIVAHPLGLTRRQSDVLELLAQGKPNKLICRDLKLSEGTVKVHVSAILKALNVHSRAQAIAELARRGVSVGVSAAR